MKLQHIVRIIDNYKNFKKVQLKNYYKKLIKKEILYKYKYNINLVEKIEKIFPFTEFIDFLFYNQFNRPLTIRFNTFKKSCECIIVSLSKKGVDICRLKKLHPFLAIIKHSKCKITTTLEYLTGLCSIQGVASFFSVLCMKIQKKEKILDLAAAPGNKSTLIGQFMNNTGILIANDINWYRIKCLVGNTHRLGIKNTIVISYNGILLPKVIKGFDRVLIDAPCTGTGIISHDNNIKFIETKKKLFLINRLQKKLLLSAIDMCNENSKTGGVIIYSTCSILIEENECIIEYALHKRQVKIITTGLNFGVPGYTSFDKKHFNVNMNKCIRFFPHIHNIDGFFICKLKKLPSKFR